MEQAALRLAFEAHAATHLYVAELLSARVHEISTTLDETLVERWARAIELEDKLERKRALQRTGDAALYTCGFFSETLEKRGVSQRYVVGMGRRAYSYAADLSRSERALIDLSENFEMYVRLLDEIREDTQLRTPQEIVKLYDRWRRTKSPRLAERLRKEGVWPQTVDEDTVH